MKPTQTERLIADCSALPLAPGDMQVVEQISHQSCRRMNTPATLLNTLIITAHDGTAAAFCRRHGVKPQSISSILNGNGNTSLSFRLLEKWANAEGYTVGMVLHPHTGDLAADALAHVRAAAVETIHAIECQEELTPEMREKLALLCDLIERT